MVAPYEADAQMTYMFNIKMADYVLTQDSDLLVFGAENVWIKKLESYVFDLAKKNFKHQCLQNIFVL